MDRVPTSGSTDQRSPPTGYKKRGHAGQGHETYDGPGLSMKEDKDDREHRRRQAWDCAQELPIIQDELKPRKLVSFAHFIICTVFGIMVFSLAFLSKSSLLLLITVAGQNAKTVESKPYILLFIGCLLIVPSVIIILKNIWKITFKDSKTPSAQTLIWVVCVETLVAFGSAVLTLVAMPKFDILTNVMLLNNICVLSACLQVVASTLSKGKRKCLPISLLAVIFLVGSCVMFGYNYIEIEKNTTDITIMIGLALGGTFLVSLSWWENYASLFRIVFFRNTIQDITRARNLVSILTSMVRIMVTAVVLGAYVPLSGQDWSSILSVSSQAKTIVLTLFTVQVISTALCRWVAVAVCKMHAVRRSFVFPMVLVSPAVFAAFVFAMWIPFQTFPFDFPTNSSISLYCGNFTNVSCSGIRVMDQMLTDLTAGVCARPTISEGLLEGQLLLGGSMLCWWIGLVFSTFYIWFLSIHRIERTRDLFGRNMYEAAFIDQSMLLNTRFELIQLKKQTKEKKNSKITIYLCATMWHETYQEMRQMMISMFKLDKFRPKNNQFNDVYFESHIFFDDAFQQDDNHRRVNKYAGMLVEVIREIFKLFRDNDRVVLKEKKALADQKILETPYGCRVQYTLPYGNQLTIHFKDRQLIRHKKRWSQVMYMYYLLGWRLTRKFFLKLKEGEDQMMPLEDHLKKEKENTYILSLDGDIDFQPSAVMLLVDRLRMYPEVGAACGRVHPIGTGPIVWFQKFEYAVSHWLQKTAEHVFGCVLCSPGCFSLFRAEALMDDNIMRKYTTKATEARHYVQYDQGEDRWLSTLLLQQGWRVEYNAASDSYTNAPQGFKEFYNQRRRWGPSTMANTFDLLATGSLTSQKNKSISRLYIAYQILNMGSSILSPATVCLMIAGSFNIVFEVPANLALVLAVIPPSIYVLLCFKLKADTQITIAAIMSTFYAFFMTATIMSVIGKVIMDKIFVTPTGLFLISFSALYITTAFFHPHEFQLILYGFLYIITIPSAFLLMAIYCMVNMNDVSWGTRETAGAKAAPAEMEQKKIKYKKKCKLCCYNLEIFVHKDDKMPVTQSSVPETAAENPLGEATTIAVVHEESGTETPEVEECWISQLRDRSDEVLLMEARLDEDEEQFWRDLQERYLKPLDEDEAKKKTVEDDLRGLRNRITFIYFVLNALWLVATLFMQTVGKPVHIAIPRQYPNGTIENTTEIFIDPIALMFVLGFATLLTIQFLGMLWHRVQTLIHFIAYQGTEANSKTRRKSMEMVDDGKNFW